MLSLDKYVVPNRVNLHINLNEFPQWGAADAEIKAHLMRTQSLKVLPLKPGVGQFIAMHAVLTARDFFLANFYPSVHSPAFFPKPLPSFPVSAVANTWLLCRPTE